MRPIVVTVGPLATAGATKVSLSQTPPAAKALAINGALATGFSATNIATAQTRVGAGNLTLNGSLVASGVAIVNPAAQVVITSSGNDSGITVTVTGLGPDFRTMQTETVTGSNTSIVGTTLKFGSVTQIAASNSAAANLSAGTNGIATLDVPRRVIITSGGNDTNKTFAITGTDWNNNPISETVTGASGAAAQSTYDFKTVTSIVPSAATASTVTVGTNGVASSMPIALDSWAPAPTALQCTVTGTVSYTVQQTLDDPNGSSSATIPPNGAGRVGIGYAALTWVDHPDTNLVTATATKQGNYAYAPRMARVTLNSGTGTVVMTLIQSSNVPL